jgi:hypothetical protein
MRFDTTSSNSGRKKAAAVLLVKLIGRKLPNLACRHHIMELTVQKVYTTLFGLSTGPEVVMFHRFKKDWYLIDTSNFALISDDRLLELAINELSNIAVEIFKVAFQNESDYCVRGDYKELLELSLIAMRESQTTGVYHFETPDALQNARF